MCKSFRMLRFVYLRCVRNHISLITEIDITDSIRHAFYIANRSVVPMNLSTSVIMSSDLDIAKCCEFAKELTLRAGKVSQ